MLRQSLQRARGSDQPGSTSPVANMDECCHLVSGWLWFGVLLLCLFREQPHHSSKPDLKHRSFDEHTTMEVDKAIRTSLRVHGHDDPSHSAFASAASVLPQPRPTESLIGSSPGRRDMLHNFYCHALRRSVSSSTGISFRSTGRMVLRPLCSTRVRRRLG